MFSKFSNIGRRHLFVSIVIVAFVSFFVLSINLSQTEGATSASSNLLLNFFGCNDSSNWNDCVTCCAEKSIGPQDMCRKGCCEKFYPHLPCAKVENTYVDCLNGKSKNDCLTCCTKTASTNDDPFCRYMCLQKTW